MNSASSRRNFLRNLSCVALLAFAGATALGLSGCDNKKAGEPVLRAGFFPNVTHAHAVIAREMAREGKPWFESRLPQGWKLEWSSFNAGPSAMESIITGASDVTYVGPSPVINLHVRTKGSHVRIVSGAAAGGSALLVPKDSALKTQADFRGKRIATPQLGNTQDVACRAWLAEGGLKFTVSGGDVSVMPTQNSDQADMLAGGRVDAVWTVEPWVSRIEKLTGAKIILSRPDETTTVLVASKDALTGPKKAAVDAFLKAHRELTGWITEHPAEALDLLHKGLCFEQHTQDIPKELVGNAFSRVKLTNKANFDDIAKAMKDAREAGLLKESSDLAPLREFYHDDEDVR